MRVYIFWGIKLLTRNLLNSLFDLAASTTAGQFRRTHRHMSWVYKCRFLYIVPILRLPAAIWKVAGIGAHLHFLTSWSCNFTTHSFGSSRYGLDNSYWAGLKEMGAHLAGFLSTELSAECIGGFELDPRDRLIAHWVEISAHNKSFRPALTLSAADPASLPAASGSVRPLQSS